MESLSPRCGSSRSVTVFVYVFAFLDAFFTAREMTAGTGLCRGKSPRCHLLESVDARLRLLLSRKATPRDCGLPRALGTAKLLFARPARCEGCEGAVGYDLGYEHCPGTCLDRAGRRCLQDAREREKQILATIQLPPRITGNFPAAIPVGLSLLLGAGYFAVAAHGLYLPNYANIDQSTARSPGMDKTQFTTIRYTE